MFPVCLSVIHVREGAAAAQIQSCMMQEKGPNVQLVQSHDDDDDNNNIWITEGEGSPPTPHVSVNISATGGVSIGIHTDGGRVTVRGQGEG